MFYFLSYLLGVGEAEQLRLNVFVGSNCSDDFVSESGDFGTLLSLSGDGVGQRRSHVGTKPMRLFNGIRYRRKGRISGDTEIEK